MKIRYKGEIVEVDYISSDPKDEDMPLCVRFPKGHELHDPTDSEPGVVWLRASDFEVVEG